MMGEWCWISLIIAAMLIGTAMAGIPSQPSDITCCSGSAASFSIMSSGTGPFSYQWNKDDVPIVGKTGPALSIDPVTTQDAGIYTVDVTNGAGTITSREATLTVNSAPQIAVQPFAIRCCLGSAASFGVKATGAPPLSYRWEKNGVDLQDEEGHISGTGTSSLAIDSVAFEDEGNYSVIIEGKCGEVTSNRAGLTVNVPPKIVDQPADTTGCEGWPASLGVTVSGTCTYRWQRFDGTGWNDLAGGSSSNLSWTALNASDAGRYRVVITSSAGCSAISGDAVLTVNSPPEIIAQPPDVSLCEGKSASFGVAASGTKPMTYQWKKDGSAILGATNATFIIARVSSSDAGNYTVDVANSCGMVTSRAATLTVNSLPLILAQPSGRTVTEGTYVIFAVGARNNNITYQWKKDGRNITGATSYYYSIPHANFTDAGNYTVALSNRCCTIESNQAMLIVKKAWLMPVQNKSAIFPFYADSFIL
jgi:hypothetical protein